MISKNIIIILGSDNLPYSEVENKLSYATAIPAFVFTVAQYHFNETFDAKLQFYITLLLSHNSRYYQTRFQVLQISFSYHFGGHYKAGEC